MKVEGTKSNFMVLYSCYHTRVFKAPAPKIGEVMWCVRCRKEVVVMKAPPEIRIKCDDCSYGRGFGTARLNAEIQAAKHRLGNPTHTVHLYDGYKIAYTFGHRNQSEISMMQVSDQEIPF